MECLSKKFRLSRMINNGGDINIRHITSLKDGSVLCCSEKGEIKIWNLDDGDKEPVLQNSFDVDVGGLTIALSLLSTSDIIALGTSNGVVKMINTKNGETVSQLIGHSKIVNSITQAGDNETIVTGSYDQTAKVWRGNQCVATLTADHAYGVEVCSLSNNKIVTGSYLSINIWEDNKIIKCIKEAHEHAIRKIVKHPLGFATCSNDGTVKLWDSAGNKIWDVYAHPSEIDVPPFVYSLSCLYPTAELVSAGENRMCCVWSGNGELVDSIEHPRFIREVIVLGNGDVATTNGGFVFVFTRDERRVAKSAILGVFAEMVRESSKKTEKIKISAESALKSAGESHGQTVVIARGSLNVVYKWDAGKRQWQEIGDVINSEDLINSENGQKSTFDHTTNIVFDNGETVSLNFNRDDEPEKVLADFCQKRTLSAEHQNEVMNHVSAHVDWAAVARRKARDAKEELSAGSKALPVWEKGAFEVKADFNAQKMAESVIEINGRLCAENPELSFSTEEELKQLNSLLALAKNTSLFHAQTFSAEKFVVVEKLLKWPKHAVFVSLDLLRVLACHAGFLAELQKARSERLNAVFGRLGEIVAEKGVLCCGLVCAVLGNVVAKLSKSEVPSDSEKKLSIEIGTIIIKLPKFNQNDRFTKNFITWHSSLVNNYLKWVGIWPQKLLTELKPVITAMWGQLAATRPMAASLSAKLCCANIINMASMYILMADVIGDVGKQEMKLCFAYLRALSEKTPHSEGLACDIAKLMK